MSQRMLLTTGRSLINKLEPKEYPKEVGGKVSLPSACFVATIYIINLHRINNSPKSVHEACRRRFLCSVCLLSSSEIIETTKVFKLTPSCFACLTKRRCIEREHAWATLRFKLTRPRNLSACCFSCSNPSTQQPLHHALWFPRCFLHRTCILFCNLLIL